MMVVGGNSIPFLRLPSLRTHICAQRPSYAHTQTQMNKLYNLGQIKWNIETTPPPKISDGKCAFWPSRTFILDLGREGISVPFYSVQDCL